MVLELTVRCPCCNAAPGAECSGYRRGSDFYHRERLQLALLHRRELDKLARWNAAGRGDPDTRRP